MPLAVKTYNGKACTKISWHPVMMEETATCFRNFAIDKKVTDLSLLLQHYLRAERSFLYGQADLSERIGIMLMKRVIEI